MNQINKEQIKDLWNLYDIQTLSQAIAEKGWAFTCKSTRQDLVKADVPTLYTDIKDKYDNAETEETASLVAKLDDVTYGSNVVYVNDKYYVAKYSSTESGLYASTDKNTWTKVLDLESKAQQNKGVYHRLYVVGNKIFFIWVTSDITMQMTQTGKIYCYDTETETSINTSETIAITRDLFFHDGKMFYSEYSTYNACYVNVDEFDADLTNKVSLNSTKQPIGHDGTYYYAVNANGDSASNVSLYRGTTPDDISTQALAGGIYYRFCMYAVKVSDTKFYIPNWDYFVVVDNGTATLITTTNTYFSYMCFGSVDSNGGFYACSESSGKAYVTTDDGTTWTEVFSDNAGLKNISFANDNVFVTGTNSSKLYLGEHLKKQYTDTYLINGNSVAINYYTKDGFKICLADGTNDANLASVYDYMGYYNYYRLDTANETVSLPRNNNLYSMMYVGDNYEDTIDGISENATRLLPQANEVTVSGTTVSLDLKGNTVYSLADAVTSLTLNSAEVSILETIIYFTTGESISFTDNASLKWSIDGSAPSTLETNTEYRILVRKGLAELDTFGTTV